MKYKLEAAAMIWLNEAAKTGKSTPPLPKAIETAFTIKYKNATKMAIPIEDSPVARLRMINENGMPKRIIIKQPKGAVNL
jgi:hypothetical protein